MHFDPVANMQLLVSGLAFGSIYALVALGFVLIYKATEMVNFAQGDVMMLGGFVAFSLIANFHLPYWIGGILAILITAAFGYALDALVLRRVIGQPHRDGVCSPLTHRQLGEPHESIARRRVHHLLTCSLRSCVRSKYSCIRGFDQGAYAQTWLSINR